MTQQARADWPPPRTLTARRVLFYVAIFVGPPLVVALTVGILAVTHTVQRLGLDGAFGLVSLVLWLYPLLFVVAEFPLLWGPGRAERIVTSLVCAEIGAAIYNCVAIIFGGALPTLAPLIDAVTSRFPGGNVVFILPVMVWFVFQSMRARNRVDPGFFARPTSIVDRPPPT